MMKLIKKNLLRTLGLGLCMSALMAGTANVRIAYARSGGGSSSAFEGTISPEDRLLFEKQKEIDQYLFVDYAKEIEKMGFKVIYTGVSDSYVEVGITPYSDKNVDYLHGIVGNELVKIVDTEEAVIYTVTDDGQNIEEPVSPDNVASPIMDMGDDTPVSDSSIDEAIIKEREQSKTKVDKEDEGEKLSIQIESIGESELEEDMAPDLIWQTDGVIAPHEENELVLSDEATDINLVSAEDDMARMVSVEDTSNEDKAVPTASIIALIAGGIIIIGGTTFVLISKKKVAKNNK